jgi:hypothetical protein
MWKKYRIPFGIGALVLLIGATVWAAKSTNKETDQVVDQSVTDALPEIKKEEIDQLEIRRPEDEQPVKLARKGDAWKVVAPVEAEVNDSAVETALDKISDLEVTGVAATKKKNHSALEVGEEKGIHVLVGRKGEQVAHLIIGNYSGGSTMVRLKGEERVLSVDGSIKYAFNKELKSWRDRTILDIEGKRAKELHFQGGKRPFRFVKNDDGKWALAEDQDPIDKFEAAQVDSLVSSLASTRAVDFAEPGMTAEQAGLGDKAATATLVLGPEDEGEESSEDGGDQGKAKDGKAKDGEKPAEGSSKEKAQAAESKTAEAERIVLRVGKKVEGKDQYYLQREGDDVIYIVSKQVKEQVQPTAKEFKKTDDDDKAQATAKRPPMGAGAKGKKLPPGVMKKLKRQMKMKKMMKKAGP